jgi:hypothetical protein
MKKEETSLFTLPLLVLVFITWRAVVKKNRILKQDRR